MNVYSHMGLEKRAQLKWLSMVARTADLRAVEQRPGCLMSQPSRFGEPEESDRPCLKNRWRTQSWLPL